MYPAHKDITVLFTDVNMPGAMNGIDLAENLKALARHVGYACELLVRDFYKETSPTQGVTTFSYGLAACLGKAR